MSTKQHQLNLITVGLKKGTSNVDAALNEEAVDGWRFKQMVIPTDSTGGSEQMIAIYERELIE